MKSGYTEVTSEIRDKIEAEIERTGISPQRALKGNKEAKEAGLNSGIVYRFTNKVTKPAKTGRKDHVELALALWTEVPDKENRQPKKQFQSYQKARKLHRDTLLDD